MRLLGAPMIPCIDVKYTNEIMGADLEAREGRDHGCNQFRRDPVGNQPPAVYAAN
jgi:hypothetical protein